MLHLPRRVIVQLAVFTVIAVGVLAITFLHFVRLPAMLFGVGRYTVTMEKASTVGTITEAGLQTQTADTAQALVAVSVQTSNAGEADPVPRAWRMRITVQRVGDRVKVSDVGFVP